MHTLTYKQVIVSNRGVLGTVTDVHLVYGH